MKTKYIFGLLALALSASCSDDEQIADFALEAQEINMEAVGGTQKVKVTVPGNWTAVATAPWVKVTPTNGTGSETCEIKVDTTLLANEMREAKVRFITRADNEEKSISIKQKGFEKALTLSTTTVALEDYADYGKRYFDVEVTSNVNFEVEISAEAQSWLNYDEYKFNLDRGATPRTTTIRFNWEGNTEPNTRDAEIHFLVDDTDLVKHDAITISQKRAPEITPDAKGDSLALCIIERKLGTWIPWDKSEPMMNWLGVRLWEESDKDCTPEKLGRVRAVEFAQFSTKDGIPEEIRHLQCLETLSFFSNGNKHLYSFDTGTAITELINLKNLRIYAFGLTTLPDEFKNLKNLVTLDLSSNNFQNVPAVLTPENFPNLKHLSLSTNRRGHAADLTLETLEKEKWGGLYEERNVLQRLLAWENLESLHLANNIIKGYIPQMNMWNMPKWTEEEVMANDTLRTAAKALIGKPKVLPHCKDLRINLNYLRGTVPDWLLNHPYFLYWGPDVLIFNQQVDSDDDGNTPGFANIPETFEYYYDLYPVYKPKN